MGSGSYLNFNSPQMFSFEFIIQTITIFEGEHQNVDPTNRFVLIEEEALETKSDKLESTSQGKLMKTEITHSENKKNRIKDKNKKKKKSKTKGKKKGQKKSIKGRKKTKDKPITKPISEEVVINTKRKQIYLPPFRVGIRFFFNRKVYVNQVELPNSFTEDEVVEKLKTIDSLEVDGKKKKKNVKPKKGDSKKKKKKKAKIHKIEKKSPPVSKEISLEAPSDNLYSSEELTWRLECERAFKRGICVTFPATIDQIILWLQRGPLRLQITRWKGYDKEIPIGTAELSFNSTVFIQTVLKKNKPQIGSSSCNTEDTADILDNNSNKIGEITISFNMFYNGGIMVSECLVSEKGFYDFIKESEFVSEDMNCMKCGKSGNDHETRLIDDTDYAIVSNGLLFDNSSYIKDVKYNEYAEMLRKILVSPNPVVAFGEHVEKLNGYLISSESLIV